MRRDMDLVRDMLNAVAESDIPLDVSCLATDTRPFELVAYHAQLIQQAGLAEANIVRTEGGIVLATVGPLTWAGNDFLDAVKSDRIWSQVKRRIASTVGAVSFDVVKALAVKAATDMLM